VTKYYYAGAQRIAMKTNGDLNFIIGGHLGSTSIVTDASGNVVSRIQYKAYPTGALREGESRYASRSEVAKYEFTGQYSSLGVGLSPGGDDARSSLPRAHPQV